MHLEFDPAKDRANIAKHGVSLAAALQFGWGDALIWPDARSVYGEDRQCAIGYIGARLHVVVFVDRPGTRRIISLRRANSREVERYDKT
jgi:uncharacterized DUF497 family protein